MNQTQRKYAINRVDMTVIQKQNETRTEFHKDPSNAKKQRIPQAIPTDFEVIRTLCGEKTDLKIKPIKDLMQLAQPYQSTYSSIRLHQLCDLSNSKETLEVDAYNAKIDEKIAALNIRLNSIQTEANRVKDLIMLGDEKEAMEALANFDKFKG